ncbi:MAG TPA: hypothetical protein VEI24_02080 [Nitrospiria bacterium]|nr:hypothetical protein [Nitrospiria bacterium]
MRQRVPEREETAMADETQADKKPRSYVKPKIEWEEPFEPVTSAISCAKKPGQGHLACMAAPKI